MQWWFPNYFWWFRWFQCDFGDIWWFRWFRLILRPDLMNDQNFLIFPPIIKRLLITSMYFNRLHACWSTQSGLATLLSPLIASRWVGLQPLWRFRLKDLSIDEMVGAWCFDCLSGPPGFTCLISFAPVFSFITVESLSLLYVLVISWFICPRRWCIDKLGVFHANQISMCLDPHLN